MRRVDGRRAAWAAQGGLLLGSLAGHSHAADLPAFHQPGFQASALTAPALPYFVRIGVSAVITDTTITARLAEVPVTGGGGSIATEPAAYVETGYYLTKEFAVSLSGGYPPTFTTKGTGTLAPFGSLYKAVVGFPVLAATYHFDIFGAFRPYAGAGVGYAIVFQDQAGSVIAPRLRNNAAFVVVGGFDYDITDRWGVFVDAKKAFLTQHFTGIGAAFPGGPTILPVTASVRTDPLLVSTGLSYRF